MSDKKLKEFSIKNERHRDYMKRKNAECHITIHAIEKESHRTYD